MKIGMIHLARHRFPPDVRIEKELRALCAAGHEVTVLVRRIDADQPAEEELAPAGARVLRVDVAEPPVHERLVSRFTLQNREWYGLLSAFVAREAPDVLHVHDLPAVPTTLHVACGLPVVADLHENMPAALRAYRSEYGTARRLRHGALYNYWLWRRHEAAALQACARVVVVVPEAAERVLEYGVPPNRIVIVSNTEDAETFCRGEAATHGEVGGSIPWVAGYVGGIGPHRGIDTALRSMPIVVAEAPHARMRLVGANDDARRVLTTEAEHLGVRGHVEVEGWRPFGDMEGIIRSCDVCLVPHNDFEHTQTTVPHKLFQYMLCRRPVLVSDVRPLARIVRETGAGLVFGAGDSDDCAAKMLELLRHPDAAARMGRLGRAAATSGYAWRHDAERLVAMFASLEREMRAKRS